MQTLTYCGPKITSTRTAVGQFKGQFNGGDGTLDTGSIRIGLIRKKAHLPHAHMARVSTPVGRWMKVQGKRRRQAHLRSRVVMDITAFKISHSIEIDRDTTALRAKKWST